MANRIQRNSAKASSFRQSAEKLQDRLTVEDKTVTPPYVVNLPFPCEDAFHPQTDGKPFGIEFVPHPDEMLKQADQFVAFFNVTLVAREKPKNRTPKQGGMKVVHYDSTPKKEAHTFDSVFGGQVYDEKDQRKDQKHNDDDHHGDDDENDAMLGVDEGGEY